jgi:hypothetical protein
VTTEAERALSYRRMCVVGRDRLAGKQTYYRCGACNTRNAYVRTGGLPHGPDHYLLAHFLTCRRCQAAKPLFDGAHPWCGEAVDAAALAIKDRPDPSGRHAARVTERNFSRDPEIRAEEQARERQLRPFLRRYPDRRRVRVRILPSAARVGKVIGGPDEGSSVTGNWVLLAPADHAPGPPSRFSPGSRRAQRLQSANARRPTAPAPRIGDRPRPRTLHRSAWWPGG